MNRLLVRALVVLLSSTALALAQPREAGPGKTTLIAIRNGPTLTGTPAAFAAALKARGLLTHYQPLQLHETLDV